MRKLLTTATITAGLLMGLTLQLGAPAQARTGTPTSTTASSAASSQKAPRTAPGTISGTTSGAPGTASVDDYRDCPDHYLCLWGDASYAGRYIFFPEGDDGGPLFVPYIGDFMNDLTTSIWNRTSRRVCFYRDANYQGLLFCMNGGDSSANIGSDANDQISSLQPF